MINSKKTFYVCSYGGSGSTYLCNALKAYGNTKHIHSRNPPSELEYVGNAGGGRTYEEWFNGIKIPQNKVNNYYVIFIYRNPIMSLYSRFGPNHLIHIQCEEDVCNKKINLDDIVKEMKDLYGIEEFYNNYAHCTKKRNYKIICIKYEELFKKQDQLSKILGIGPLNFVKKERKHIYTHMDKLNILYKDLINKMMSNEFIMIN